MNLAFFHPKFYQVTIPKTSVIAFVVLIVVAFVIALTVPAVAFVGLNI